MQTKWADFGIKHAMVQMKFTATVPRMILLLSIHTKLADFLQMSEIKDVWLTNNNVNIPRCY